MRRPASLLWAAVLPAAALLCFRPSLAQDVVPEAPLEGRLWQSWGKQLDATLIRTVSANSVIQCSLHCLGLEQCLAANFRPPAAAGSDPGSDAGSGNCDLLETHSGSLQAAEAGAVSLRLPGSCHGLQSVGYRTDGVYRHRGLPAPLYCDMTLDDGGWTLLVAAVSTEGWTIDYVIERRRETPGIDINYSILGLGEQILSVSSRARYNYRLEAGGRQRWGGIWGAKRSHTLTGSHSNQTASIRLATFDNWQTIPNSTPLDIVPWVNRQGAFDGGPLLTTCDEAGQQWFGTLVTAIEAASHGVSPWIQHNEESKNGPRLYWVREKVMG